MQTPPVHAFGRRTLLAAPLLAAAPAPPARVRIGVLGDFTSIYRDISGPIALACAQLAVAESNPGAAGFGVDVLSADHRNNAGLGAAIAQSWIENDQVDMITDCPNSSVALRVAEICRAQDRVFIATSAASADLTGPACAPTTLHWTMDTWMLARSTVGALDRRGNAAWFFLTADDDFGTALTREAASFVTGGGARVVGERRLPLGTQDFRPALAAARASGAKIVGLCNAGGDTVTAIRQARAMGVPGDLMKLAGLLVFISEVHALGLPVAQGLVLTESFYWNLDDRTRAFARRLAPRIGDARPGMAQAGTYAGTLHYLQTVALMGAVEARRSGAATVARMKSLPTHDDAFGKNRIREDGRVLHPAFLFQVKSPEDSRGEWDLYRLLDTTPSDRAFRPIGQGGCPLVPA